MVLAAWFLLGLALGASVAIVLSARRVDTLPPAPYRGLDTGLNPYAYGYCARCRAIVHLKE